METVLPLLNKILENNQLVKGRLRVSQSELEKLYQSLENNTDQLKKKLYHQEELIRSQIRKRNRIKFQLKRNLESINKTFHPSKKNISLLFKKQGESSYIKARLYWGGRQREVQVGSIAIVLKMINNMIKLSKKYLVITTPNRLYPIDFHTKIPLIHWFPKNLHRFLLKIFGLNFLSKEENLNLLSKNELKKILGNFSNLVDFKIENLTLFGCVSNFIVIGKIK